MALEKPEETMRNKTAGQASGLFRALPKVLDFQLRANGSDAEGSSNRREDTAHGKSGDHRSPELRLTDSHSADQRRSWKPEISVQYAGDERRRDRGSEAGSGEHELDTRQPLRESIGVRLPDISPPLIQSPDVERQTIPTDWRRPYLRPTDSHSATEYQGQQRRSWIPKVSVEGPAHTGGRGSEDGRRNEDGSEAGPGDGATAPRDPAGKTLTFRLPDITPPLIRAPSVAEPAIPADWRRPYLRPTDGDSAKQDQNDQRRPWLPRISVDGSAYSGGRGQEYGRRPEENMEARSSEGATVPRDPSATTHHRDSPDGRIKHADKDADYVEGQVHGGDPKHRETAAFRIPDSIAPLIHSPSAAAPVESGDRRLPDSHPTKEDREGRRRPWKPEISVEWPTHHKDGRSKDEGRNAVDIQARADERDADSRHPSRENIASTSSTSPVESGDRRLPDSHPTNQDREGRRRPWKPEISVEWPTYHTDGRPKDERPNEVASQARSDERDADPRHPSRETIAIRFPDGIDPRIHSPSVAAQVESGDRRSVGSHPTNQDRDGQPRSWKPEISVEWPTHHTDGRPKDERRNSIDTQARSDERDADPRHPSRETIAIRFPDGIDPRIHSPGVAAPVESGDRRSVDSHPTSQDREGQRRPWKPEISVEWPTHHTDGRPKDERRNSIDIQARSDERDADPRHPSRETIAIRFPDGIDPRIHSPNVAAQVESGDRRSVGSHPTNQDRDGQPRPWKPEISVEWPTHHTDGRPRDGRPNAVDIQARSDGRDSDPRHPSRETIASRFPDSIAPPIHSPGVAATVESGDRRLPDNYSANQDREGQRRPWKPEISVEWPTHHTDGRPKDERRNAIDIQARSDERDADPRHSSRETIAIRFPDGIDPRIHSPGVAAPVESGDRRSVDSHPTGQDREGQRRPWKPEISVEWPTHHTDGRPTDERRNTGDTHARSSEGAVRDSSDAGTSRGHVEGQVHGRGTKHGSPESGLQAGEGRPGVTPEFGRRPTTRRGRQRPQPQSLQIVYEDKPKPVVYEIVVNMPVQAETQEVPAGPRAGNK
nr:unnamed protein product [Spirometra erinaceieuropaei]